MNFKAIFHLDGRGVYYDPNEPIHLDDILTFFFAILQGKSKPLGRDDVPDAIPLPLSQRTVNGHDVWCASALFPEGEGFETLSFWRKRFQQDRIMLSEGSPNLTNGVYREYNMPFPLLVVPRMVAYAKGERSSIKRALQKNCKALGKKRAYGKGCVVQIECEEIEEDWSLSKDGKATRYLPKEGGTRLVRAKPPYWNMTNRVPCCDVGDDFELNNGDR